MKGNQFFKFVFVLLALFASVNWLYADDNTEAARAKSLLNHIDDMWWGKSSYAVTTRQVKTQHYTRTMKMESWSKGKEQTLFRIIEPVREKGTTTLQPGNHIYTYLAKTDHTIKLTSGKMMGSWMDSHLTNDI
jgi:hypothetical protein